MLIKTVGELMEDKARVRALEEGSRNAAPSDATEIISKYENGENYIAIYIDNIEISRPSVKQKIDSTDCQITGDFEAEDVSYLASQIGSGTLPFDLKVVGEK